MRYVNRNIAGRRSSWPDFSVTILTIPSARTLRSGGPLVLKRWHWIAGLAGGVLVILSWTVDAGALADGGMPGPYPWPVFAAGLLLALVAAFDALRAAQRPAGGAPPRGVDEP